MKRLDGLLNKIQYKPARTTVKPYTGGLLTGLYCKIMIYSKSYQTCIILIHKANDKIVNLVLSKVHYLYFYQLLICHVPNTIQAELCLQKTI